MNNQPFLCLTNADLEIESPVIQAVAYCPGLVCTRCQMPLSYGFILKKSTEPLELLGKNCANEDESLRWIEGIKHLREFKNKTEIQSCEYCLPKEKEYFRKLALYNQIFPEDASGRYLYTQLWKNGELEDDQVVMLHELLHDCWNLKNLMERRDTFYRLAVLASLGDQLGKQQSLILGLLKLIKVKNMTRKQMNMVVAIQKSYGSSLALITEKFLANWPPVNGSMSLSI